MKLVELIRTQPETGILIDPTANPLISLVLLGQQSYSRVKPKKLNNYSV